MNKRTDRQAGSRRRRILGVAVAAATITIAAASSYVGWGRRAARRAPAVEDLRIALPAVPQAGIIHIASEKGFFADEGLRVKVISKSHGLESIGSVVQGEADLGVASEVPFTIAVLRGQSLGLVTCLVSLSSEDAIIARRDRGIATPGDLAGKKIGVTFGTSGSYALWSFLIRHRVPTHLVILVDVEPAKMKEAIASGSVDAIASWQPITFDVRAALGGNALTFSDLDAYKTRVVVVGQRDYLNSHVGAVTKLVRGLLGAEFYIRANSELALGLVAEWLKIDRAALRPMWKQMDFSVDLLQTLLTTLEDQARWAMVRGYGGEGRVPNFLPHLYLNALLAARPERVTVLH